MEEEGKRGRLLQTEDEFWKVFAERKLPICIRFPSRLFPLLGTKVGEFLSQDLANPWRSPSSVKFSYSCTHHSKSFVSKCGRVVDFEGGERKEKRGGRTCAHCQS